MTLQTVITFCQKAVDIYNTHIEEIGSGGDYESAKELEEEMLRLERVLKCLSEDYETNKILDSWTIMDWLKNLDNKEIYEAILEALKVVKIDSEIKIERIGKVVTFADLLLDTSKSCNSYAEEKDECVENYKFNS